MSFVYPHARALAWSGGLDLTAGTIRAMVVTTASSILDDVAAESLSDFVDLAETTVSGYTAGGEALTTRSIENPGTGPVRFKADNLDFGVLAWGSGEQLAGLLVYLDTGDPATDVPIAAIDQVDPNGVAFPYTPVNVPFLVEWLGGVVFEL